MCGVFRCPVCGVFRKRRRSRDATRECSYATRSDTQPNRHSSEKEKVAESRARKSCTMAMQGIVEPGRVCMELNPHCVGFGMDQTKGAAWAVLLMRTF